MTSSFTYTGLDPVKNFEGAGALSHVQQYLDLESSDSDVNSEASSRLGFSVPSQRACVATGLAVACLAGIWLALPWATPQRSADWRDRALVEAGESVGFPLNATVGALAPAEDLHDGNVCGDDEELFAGLCYKKCFLLTGGRDPIRTSPWTCCSHRPCLMNQKGSVGKHVACTGYDVSGDGSCPHEPGACLEDEELFLGTCYKKCELLTNFEYTNRVAPETCCKASGLACLDFLNDWTSKEFAVGGGDNRPGACLEDEEMLMGVCYKKCSLLTHNNYPHRVAAATCCKAGNFLPHIGGGGWHLGCLDPWKDKTSPAFDTAGDSHSVAPHEKAHPPLESLTEA